MRKFTIKGERTNGGKMEYYFTGDQHLGHKNIIRYSNRPFTDIHEMDKAIIEKASTVPRKGDKLICLGDLSFHPDIAESYIRAVQQKGIELLYCRGNHDKNIISLLKRYNIPIYDLKTIKVKDQVIVLCHYAMRVWDRSHYGSWQLYGHSHNSLPPIGKQYDVGVDGNDFAPISFTQLKLILDAIPIQISDLRSPHRRYP